MQSVFIIAEPCCAYSCLTLCDLLVCSPLGSCVHGDSPGKNAGIGNLFPSSGDLPNPGIEQRSPASQADSFNS